MHVFITKQQRGFTFIELILYIAILMIMFSTIMPFTLSIINSRVKANTQRELSAQARFIAEKIKYEIRNSSDINSVTTDAISLETTSVATNPTIITYSLGNITIKKGVNAAITLNSEYVTLPSFTFTNNSDVSNTTKNITYEFTLTDNLSSSRKEYIGTTLIKSSVEVRGN